MGEEGFAGSLPMECRGVWGWSPHQCGAALTAGKQHCQHQQDLHLPFAPLGGETEGGISQTACPVDRHCLTNIIPLKFRSNPPQIWREGGSHAPFHLSCFLLAKSKCILKLSHPPSVSHPPNIISHLPSRHFGHTEHHFAAAVPLYPWGCNFPAQFFPESNDVLWQTAESSPPAAYPQYPPPAFLFRCRNAAAPQQQRGDGGSRSPGNRSGSAPPCPARGL